MGHGGFGYKFLGPLRGPGAEGSEGSKGSKVQGWWWRLCRKHKRGAAGAAGCVEGLYRRVV